MINGLLIKDNFYKNGARPLLNYKNNKIVLSNLKLLKNLKVFRNTNALC
jgi:hypothetical protein